MRIVIKRGNEKAYGKTKPYNFNAVLSWKNTDGSGRRNWNKPGTGKQARKKRIEVYEKLFSVA